MAQYFELLPNVPRGTLGSPQQDLSRRRANGQEQPNGYC